MATAADTSTDWISLREALALAAAALGSQALAKERLLEWLAAGQLPWSCASWKGEDAAGVAKLQRESRKGPVFFFPSAGYREGDARFWEADLAIDWEDNGAREMYVVGGAQALGIKVSHGHLFA